MFLLDTNVVSELRKAKAGKADQNVVAWVKSVPRESLFLSAIVIQELEIGALLAQWRGARKAQSFARGWMTMFFGFLRAYSAGRHCCGTA
jgi:predicted nucleic acid-binding protein